MKRRNLNFDDVCFAVLVIWTRVLSLGCYFDPSFKMVFTRGALDL
jgi:hypothetical protein